MGLNLAQKIIKEHLVSGEMKPGTEIAIRIDQTLTQDSTGTMAYLQFEAMGIPRVKTKKSVAYIDHNTLQTGFENADDHKYIQTVAAKHGIYFSKPGNGICHQVHLERFGVPGMTLLGSDSHTPTGGGIGMLAIGAGGLDVAVAMGGGPYYMMMPKVCRVVLKGALKPWVTAKDIILEVLRRLSVKGGVGKIIEYAGDGIKTLTVPERATITNMGAELGATTSIFPSDEVTREFLRAQGRENDWVELKPDEDAEYDEEIVINLDELEPLAAQPHSPDNVAKVKDIGKIKVDQVAIGSCTNSSYMDMMKVAAILKGKKVHPDVSLVIAPGSKQVLTMLAQNGALADMVAAGARILESACGPCIGMGQAPATDAVSLRTFNRNFEGRSGTKSAKVYLVSPETAAASAITGVLIDPRELGEAPKVSMPEKFVIDDSMVLPPAPEGAEVEVVRGPNIKPFPINQALADKVSGKALIKVGDNITTDHIMPSNAKLLPFRSNVPYLAEFCLTPCDPDFPKRAKENGGGFIIGGSNYGQGSSREHAALAPLQLGVKGVIAKSFARIHMANLINSGIIPMTFENEADYDEIDMDDELVIENAREQIKNGSSIVVKNVTKGKDIKVNVALSQRQVEIILAGGLLNYTRQQNQ
ncbi:MAG TPA: aconitate hydratase [Hungateiclostridium thermocellum]|uniref:Aconitate hydratase n=2 Tax=Acetivibrio thermocellus TaxID=1515 RepID=A3DK74_ACET2|nr:aconitate hydratase [Acetivibrio thermocellus]ABN54353.1 aconitate hydratase [Acetivibrio thermocellus ATCC 27405]ADU73787.1 aconitate hydratase [Acetivibrio thermocellus DSM 1313]ALX07720.1 aconitate hydratase [Acetivibrio thermocellus AD2]ANV75462.1 aconitate hydratase [Acetivibrio thermocellus DSM 2360]EIC05678.1 aconitate hydratase [Acetivibrio thermocellus YS]